MRSVVALALVLVAGCAPASYDGERLYPLTATPPADPLTCQLAPAYDGKLKFPGVTDRAVLHCDATNSGLDMRAVCEQVYVGVRATGALYTSHEPACSSDLPPGTSEQFTVRLDAPRALCADARGCVVRAFALGLDDTPDAAAVIAMGRDLEDHAPEPGRDRPTVRQCDDLVDAWKVSTGFARYAPFIAQRAELLLACTELSRADFGCLRAARDATEADRCAPVAHVARN